MSRCDPLLKTLQVRPNPPEALVQAYLIHIADRSDTNFRKILDLKGIRRADQSALLDIFIAHKASPSHENLPASSTLMTPLQLGTGHGAGIGSLGNASSMATPGIGAGRFDPAGLGNAMLGAVREGVEGVGRLGEIGPGGENKEGKLNENLKNIGKFFRRDGGGLRGWGRSEEK